MDHVLVRYVRICSVPADNEKRLNKNRGEEKHLSFNTCKTKIALRGYFLFRAVTY